MHCSTRNDFKDIYVRPYASSTPPPAAHAVYAFLNTVGRVNKTKKRFMQRDLASDHSIKRPPKSCRCRCEKMMRKQRSVFLLECSGVSSKKDLTQEACSGRPLCHVFYGVF